MPVPSPSQPTQRTARLIVTGLLAAMGLAILWDFLDALAWATVFAIATWPLYSRFARLIHAEIEGAVVAPLAFTVLIGALFLVPLALIAIELGRETLFVARLLPSIGETGLPVPDFVADLPLVAHSVGQWWQANLADPHAAQALFGRIDRNVVIEWTRTLGTQLARRSSVLVFTLLTLFFLYREGLRLVREIEAVVMRVVGESGHRVGLQMVMAVRGTVNGLVLVGVAEGALLGAVYVVLDLPHAALFGGLTGILAMIPFGAPVVYGIAALILLGQSGVASALTLVGIGTVVVFIADHFVRPVLIGGAVKLPFLWVLLGILGGLESFGLLGLFLGPAVLAALIALWREWVAAAEEANAEG